MEVPDPADLAGPYVEEALGVATRVEAEGGRFVVYLDAVLTSGAVTRRVSDWPDRGRAEVAARELLKGASAHIVPPPAEPA